MASFTSGVRRLTVSKDTLAQEELARSVAKHRASQEAEVSRASADAAIANSAMTTVHSGRERATMELARNIAEIAALEKKYKENVNAGGVLNAANVALANMYQRQANVLKKKNAAIETRLAGFDQTEVHLEMVRGNKDLVEARRSLDAYADTGAVDPATLLEAEDALSDKLRVHDEITSIIVGEQEALATDGAGLIAGSLYTAAMEQVAQDTEALVSLGMNTSLPSGSRPGSGGAGILREESGGGAATAVALLAGVSATASRPQPSSVPPPSASASASASAGAGAGTGAGDTSFLDF